MATKSEPIKKVIADSSGLISLISETDSNHTKAVKIMDRFKKAGYSILIPVDVFSEIINIVGKKFGHSDAVQYADLIMGSDMFTLIDTAYSYPEALIRFRDITASASFTDCLVMAMADYFKTKAIFGFDKIFTKSEYKTKF